MTSISPPPPSASSPPPSAEVTLENVTSLLAESVGRNTLAMVESIRNLSGRLERSDLLVALSLARMGRATVDELVADFHNMNTSVARTAVELALLILEERGVVTHDERGEVWSAVAR